MDENAEGVEERLRRLVELADALSRAVTVSEVAEAAVATGADHLRANSVSICLLERHRNRYVIAAAGGLRPQDRAAWISFPADAPVPVADAVAHDRAVVVKSLEDRRRRYPVFGDQKMMSETLVAAPMRAGGEPAGALTIGFTDIRVLDDGDLAFIQAVADLAGQAVHRARLAEYQQATLARQRFLADAAMLLASDLDHQSTLVRVARLAVGEFADACLLLLVDEDGALRTVAATHAAAPQQRVLDALVARQPIATNPQLLEVVRTGEAIFTPVVSAEEQVDAAEDSEHLALLRQLAVTGGVVVPLRARGRVLGLLMLLMTDDSRELTDDDRVFAEDLASRSALAIDNARLATERLSLVENLKIALESRTVIEQAKGALAGHLDMSPAEAFDLMRRAARSQRRKLDAVAEDILDGDHDVVRRSA